MAALYPGTSVSGYNSNPPPDDGTTVSTNLITWAGIKTKLGDPVNTFAGNVDSNITAAFGKTLDGATVVSTGISYGAAAADQGRLIKATASGITITVPPNSVSAPFTFAVTNQSTGTITIAGNASNIDGAATQIIQPGGGCILKFDGTNWFSFGLTPAQISATGAQHGFDMPVNLGLTASVNSSILTVAVKTKAGNDPSSGDPVLIPFRDSTIANGGPVWLTLTGALSINTNAIGATLGTVNSVPFRFWIVAFNNGGSVVLGLYQTVAGGATPTAINPINETALASSTGISAAATSAGVFYTPNGTSISSKSFRIIGWLEYAAGLATAGTYSSVPTTLQLFGPGCKMPGEIVQQAYATNSSTATTASATKVATSLTASISPTSAANLVEVVAMGSVNPGATDTTNHQISRGSGPTLIGTLCAIATGASPSGSAVSLNALDSPGTTSATAYTVYIWLGSGSSTSTWLANGGTGTISIKEIMA